MQIINKIDRLISQLNSLKPKLSDEFTSNEKKFNELLKSNIEANSAVAKPTLKAEPDLSAKFRNDIPAWVDLDYGYDPRNPRKPNMRELIEASSEKSIEELYNTNEADWQKIRNQASEILYGVVGSNTDKRDWLHIMASENIIQSAQEHTGAMYDPYVDILSNFDENNVLTEQVAILKDKEGNRLRSLPENLSLAGETLRNFGATKDSIPDNLDEIVDPNIFDKNLLTFLKNFDTTNTSIDNIIIQSASEAISGKLLQEIPLEELTKL